VAAGRNFTRMMPFVLVVLGIVWLFRRRRPAAG
jgi:MYXO-CTERM domain-containing protein